MADYEGLDRRGRYGDTDHGTRIALLEQSTQDIKRELGAINSNITRLVWLLVTALVLSVMKFALSGGLV